MQGIDEELLSWHSFSTRSKNPVANSATAPELPGTSDRFLKVKETIYPLAAICIIVLTGLGICYSLYFTKAVMLPIVGAFLLNFLFSPIVLRMNRLGIPNVLGTFLVIGFAIGAIVITLAFAYQPAKTWLIEKDQNMEIVKRKLSALQQPVTAIRDMTEQIEEIGFERKIGQDFRQFNSSVLAKQTNSFGGMAKDERQPEAKKRDPESSSAVFADGTLRSAIPLGDDKSKNTKEQPSHTDSVDDSHTVASQAGSNIVPVEVQQPSISNRLFSTTGDAFAGISLMLVLLFYLLSAGDRGLEKLVELMPTFRDKKRVVELSRAIEKSISDYLFTTTLINIVLGLFIGTGMWCIGMPNPILWGAMAMFLNYFPFVGAIIGAGIVFLAAVVSFESIAFSMWAPAIYLSANLVEANFITPVLLDKATFVL